MPWITLPKLLFLPQIIHGISNDGDSFSIRSLEALKRKSVHVFRRDHVPRTDADAVTILVSLSQLQSTLPNHYCMTHQLHQFLATLPSPQDKHKKNQPNYSQNNIKSRDHERKQYNTFDSSSENSPFAMNSNKKKKTQKSDSMSS